MQAWLLAAFDFARSSKQYSDDLGRDRALCATLTANVSSTNFPSPASADDFENFLAWTRIISGFGSLGAMEDSTLDALWKYIAFPPEEVTKAQGFVQTLVAVGKRKLFMSDEGYLGLGPEGVEEGDLIAIFHGAATPFVVRRQFRESIAEMYALVGECYMHGLMNGEGLSLAKEQEIVLQ